MPLLRVLFLLLSLFSSNSGIRIPFSSQEAGFPNLKAGGFLFLFAFDVLSSGQRKEGEVESLPSLS
ncbi:hypothetical protein JCM9152_1647 [Halalkalibacter hemicellulosilyticusJCM 9152]|uniref:Uncharacterized protein n=1 Tax=Halalkalibacter hemicellulosilyticusJCM 9152 TaxID=1236971 RepID=W4QDW2_9BACI|nr:hypothetical protein JCM9152_1647 [Halalkalibacter hemicellulosilyticusJCM 9152]